MCRPRRALDASSKVAVMRARMSGRQQPVDELDHVPPDALAQRPAPDAAAEQALIRPTVEQIDEQDGVDRQHEEPRLVLREGAASEASEPLRERLPCRREDVPLDADVDVLVLDDAAQEELRDVRVVGEEVEQL